VSGDPSVFIKRGIDEWVWRSRPYIRWTREDPGAVKALFASLAPSQRRFVSKIVNQADGYAIVRHAIPGEPPAIPQLRPDKPVITQGPVIHWHADSPRPTYGEFREQARTLNLKRPLKVDADRSPDDPCPDWILLRGQAGSAQWARHINRGLRQLQKGEPPAPDDHCGHNVQALHKHQPLAKYVFVPMPPKIEDLGARVHDHADYKQPANRSRHVERQHEGVDVVGYHTHTYPARDPRLPEIARRIDVHPLAWQRIVENPVVFFVIEGCLKADAVLSAGGAVFSVPSVSLWNAAELGRFAVDYLFDKTVIIVPDADWADNALVINQARMAETELRRRGVPETHVAAPPPRLGRHKTKGVDDFIGAHGRLKDLVVLDCEEQCDIHAWIARHGRRRDQIERDEEVLRALSRYTSASDGIFKAPLQTLAHVIKVQKMSVSRAIRSLAALGAVTINGDLTTRRRWFELDWNEDQPEIVLAPELRSFQMPEQRLGHLVQVRITEEAI
jgi:hypothetical protein